MNDEKNKSESATSNPKVRFRRFLNEHGGMDGGYEYHSKTCGWLPIVIKETK